MVGSKSNNNAALDYQKYMDLEAQGKEDARQARIKSGLASINAIYDGSPVMANRTSSWDWGDWGNRTSQFGTYASAGGQIDGTQVPGMPAGYTYKTIPGTTTTTIATPGQSTAAAATPAAATPAATTPAATKRVVTADTPGAVNVSTNPNTPNWQVPSSQPIYRTGFRGEQMVDGYRNSDGSVTQEPKAGGGSGGGTTTTGATTYGIIGPDGKVYKQGDKLSYDESYDTGQRTGGFNDAYYNKYNQAYLDLNNPQEQHSYNFAKQKLLYNALDQGIVNSSMMGSSEGELARQDTINKGQIVNDASTATANLRKSVDDQKQAVINQLYSTNDPDIAATAAQSSAKALQLQSPTLTPGSAWFDPALSALGGYTNVYTSPFRQGQSASSGGSTPTTSPVVAPASKGTGHLY